MAYSAESKKHLLRAINEFLDDSIVLPPGQLENPDLLQNISKYQNVLAQRKRRKQLEEKRRQEKKGKTSQTWNSLIFVDTISVFSFILSANIFENSLY